MILAGYRGVRGAMGCGRDGSRLTVGRPSTVLDKVMMSCKHLTSTVCEQQPKTRMLIFGFNGLIFNCE